MPYLRTDLAVEARTLWQERVGETTRLKGVKARRETWEDVEVDRVEILDQRGREALGKPEGRYLSLDLTGWWENRGERFASAAAAVARGLGELLPPEGTVFVAGLGNRSMTPDAIGPLTVEHLLVTRHLREALPQLRPVCAAAAGVLGTTGLESAEWVRGLAVRAESAAVIVIDALAARDHRRLCATVQLSDTGIIPGSGVGNRRMALNRETMGVPVLSVGVPTVVEAATLAADLAGKEGLDREGRGLFVTPRDIDAQVRELGKLLGYGISLALQPELTAADLTALLR